MTGVYAALAKGIATVIIAARIATPPPPTVAIAAPPSAAALASQLALELGILGAAVTYNSAAPGIAAIVVIDESGGAATIEMPAAIERTQARVSIHLDPTVPIRVLALQIVEEVRRVLRMPGDEQPPPSVPIASPPTIPSAPGRRAERGNFYLGGGAGSRLGDRGLLGRAAAELTWRPRFPWLMAFELALAWPTEAFDAPEGSAHLHGGTVALGLRRALRDDSARLHLDAGLGAGAQVARIDGSPASGYAGTSQWAAAATIFAKGVVSVDLTPALRLVAAAQAGVALPALRVRFAGRDVSQQSVLDAAATVGFAAVFR